MENKDLEPITSKNTPWLKIGLIFGILMFCFWSLPEIISDDVPQKYIITQISIWLIVGAAFGGIMKFFLERRRNV